ncbi:unnamed protein product [Tuber melanosporum]|uniref:DnaJ homolog 1, mitochondrial n=1 Tax=Tuber melanosporum (strain Mel28) TaxID=656061 RepID=D5GE67_TUBMM|nr:uncharacterized protein GSTUM_00006401001 [Tuber melanosporum]CAZ82810.1 unnamed protein product [Tuber melanosporum]
MSFIPPVLPRAVRVLRTSSNPITNFRCSYAPTLPRSLPVPRNSNHSPRRSFHSTPRSQASVKNPYSVLGLDKNASTSAIKKAYYSLAKKWHPDQNKDSSAREKFQEIQSAYEILSDPEKKEQFDQYGEAAFKPSAGFNPGTGAGFGQSGFREGFPADFSFEDLFSAFGGSSGRGTSGSEGGIPFGDNIEVETTISFMEAAKGVSKDIHIHAYLPCKTWAGTGMKSGTQRQPCGRCGGTGTRVHFMQGNFQMASTCDACKGAGVVIPRGSECGTCDGWGVTKEPRTITIDIPAGVDTGMRIKVDNEGDAPHSKASGASSTKTWRGDLFVHLRVAPHKYFRRKGLDVYYTATIPLTTALLGGRIRVPTLSGGEEDIEVPLGTTTGDTTKIYRKGMRGFDSVSVGNFTVEFKVNPPKTLTARQRILLEMLAEELDDKTARRIMGVNSEKQGPSPYEQHKNENFIKRAWHNLTHQHDDMPKDDDDQKKASGSG